MTPYGGNLQNTNTEFRLWHLLMSRPSHIFCERHHNSVWAGYGSGNPVMIKNGCIVCARRSKQIRRILYYCKPGRVDIHWWGNARAILACLSVTFYDKLRPGCYRLSVTIEISQRHVKDNDKEPESVLQRTSIPSPDTPLSRSRTFCQSASIRPQ